MAAVFDPSQPFEVVEGETLDSLIAPRPRPVAPVVAAPVGPVFDPSLPFTPVADAPPAGPVFDPSAPVIKVYGVDEFAAKSVDELLADKDFMPVQFGVQHENDLVDPALRSKLEEVYAARERAGTSLKDKVKSTFTGIFPAVRTLTEGVKAAARLAEKFSPTGLAKRVIAGTPQEVINDYAKSGTEAAASVELAALGSTDLIRRSNRAVGEAIGLLPGDLPLAAAVSGVPVRRSKADMTEGDWRNRLSDDIAAAKQVEVAGAGNGEVMQALGIDAATLEQDFGIKVDPEEIAKLSVVTDPINYVPLGATVGAVTKLGGKAVRLGVAATRTSEQAAKLANILNTATVAASAGKSAISTLAGTAAKAVGGAAESVGLATGKVIGPVGLIGGTGLGALLGGNVYSALKVSAALQAIPQALLRGGKALKAGGKILTGEAAAPAALTLAGDTLKAGAAGAVKGALEGGALILPFEIGARPEEEEQLLGMVGLGAGLRGGAEGVRPGARAAGRAAQNKLAETIFQTVEQQPLAESPTYGTDSLLDFNHTANVAKISPREQKLVAWGRELLRAAGGEVYVLDTPTFAREAQGNKTARGYAVSIGETVAPDGSAKPLFRILLNRDAEALPHEFFHALTDLDPKRAADFRDVVQKSLTPDQLRSFEQLYNSLRNDGLPEVQWKTRLTPEQVANEAAAETFSRIFLAQDLSGVAPSVQNKAALFVSSLLEKLGAPLAGVNKPRAAAGVSTLGVRPGTDSVKMGQAWVKNMLQRVNDEGTLGQPPIIAERPKAQIPIPTKLVSQKPAGAKPVPPAPVPVPAPRPAPVNPPLPAVPTAGKRNIRTTRAAQNDFAGQRAEVTNVEPARAAAEATGDANTVARVKEISDLIEAGSPVVEIEHSGVRAAGTAEAPSGRTARRAEQEAAYIAEGMAATPQPIREAYQKVFVPVRWEIVGGKPQLLAMSLDKVIANTHKIVKEAAARDVAQSLPYEITDGKLTDNGWGQVVDDLKAYADNQANGYRGDGQKLVRPTEDVGLSIPAENPAYSPRVISEERANFLNMVQGLNPPLTARVGKQSSTVLPGNVKGQILAEVNARQPETPSIIRPEDITKQEFKTVPGRSVAETNPLRNELAAAGVPVRELIEVTERINAADINSVRPRPELDFKAPVTDTIRGGFLPGDTAKQISEVQAMSGDEFTAATRAWDGGLTKRAWDTGLSTKTPEDVLALKMAQEDATAKGKALRAEKKTSEAMPWIYKSQFFREAYEAATDTLSAAGPNGWRNAFPDRTAPFPEAKPTGDFLPGAETDKALRTGQIKDPKPSTPDGNEDVRSIAATYATGAGITKTPHTSYDDVNLPVAKKLADFYEDAKDSPEDPAVAASYKALVDETLAQYQVIKDSGYTIEPFTGEGEPYKSSAEMVADVRENRHLFFLKTEGNFSGSAANPMLAPGPDGLAVNDVFRAVHDFFGHAKEGYQFGPRGEFNAWKAHSTMFTDAAQGSLAAETLAQNSWVNYGKHIKEGTAPKDRPFAEQKAVVVPAELIAEARGDFLPTGREWDEIMAKRRAAGATPKVAAKPTGKLTPATWILPDGEVKSVSTTYHEQDLAANFSDYNKRFGTDFNKDTGADDQVKALNKGFVRVRYAPENGRTAVEVGVGFWGKQKAKVLDTLLNSTDKIDTLKINLIDEDGTALDTVSARIFNADDKAAAITDAVNEVVAPTVKRAKGVAPTDIQRMRSLPGPGDFLPATEAGKAWADKGVTFELDIQEQGPARDFTLRAQQGDKEAGAVRGTILKGVSDIFQIEVRPDLRRQGLGEALYRELGSVLQSEGVREVGGDIANLGALRLRKKVFPETVSDENLVTVSKIRPESSFLPGDVTPLLDLGLPSEERMKQVRVKSRVSNAREKFPEALAPEYQKDEAGKFVLGEDGKPKPIVQEYQFMESPLAREAAKGLKGVAREEAFTDALAKKLVTAAKAGAKRADIQAGAKWYSTTRTRLKGLLGEDSKIFAELLGATSARTPVDTNFRFAVDAYNQFKSGEYDSIIAKYREGKDRWDAGQIEGFPEENPTRGQFLDWWVVKNDLSPTQSNGKKFGMNSRAVLRVLDGSWADEVQGPKTPNFAGNLSGDTFEATVDVWAARLLHRLSNEGGEAGKRWRILPENETGVTDADFYLGQAAYRKAADKLGMKPDSLQAILWFLEKDYWEKKGWTRGAGAAKSDFQSLLSDTERTDAGQLRRKTPQNELALPMEPGDIQARK